MTVIEKMIEFMQTIENAGANINTLNNNAIVLRYYRHIGIDTGMTMTQYLMGVSNNQYPAYSSLTRAIRKARELHPRWKKIGKRKRIQKFKKVVGYDVR